MKPRRGWTVARSLRLRAARRKRLGPEYLAGALIVQAQAFEKSLSALLHKIDLARAVYGLGPYPLN